MGVLVNIPSNILPPLPSGRGRCAVSANLGSATPPINLPDGVSRSSFELPSGLRMEVLSCPPSSSSPATQSKIAPVVFVHGSYHAAWCWAVHWLPHFSQAGHHCFALSLLGQGESDPPADRVPQTLELHASDVANFIESKLHGIPPVLVGHSFGGLIVQYYLHCLERYPMLASAVLACSVPPTGNTAVVMRFLKSKPLASIKVTWSLAAKGFARSLPLCRETFFSPDINHSELARYQALMRNSSTVPLFDLRKLNASLPIGPPSPSSPPVLVIGSENDFILDEQAVRETGAFFNAKEHIISSIAHDIMLDTQWRKAADVVLDWLRHGNIQG
ncbi:uncharacterized protein LOC9660563 [Selaginella moellendorffii]|uniref:uncharacterized protein LOC9660563 n=1 Tax=Selaginella moellendorffii TaxID=88036 RepID=UPI000D1D0239|nr:uncharacterized protein LOC9660563 [Selaginella moellendorffii]|eukprot:XP_024520530.1 uncharacterized protein LOC9660563 [Selaginella moellendorffii]